MYTGDGIGEKQPNSGYILKGELIGFADGWGVRCERGGGVQREKSHTYWGVER